MDSFLVLGISVAVGILVLGMILSAWGLRGVWGRKKLMTRAYMYFTVGVVLLSCAVPLGGVSVLAFIGESIHQPSPESHTPSGLLFAGAVLAAFTGFVLVLVSRPGRKLQHRSVGHCPKCGYDLRGDLDNGCSECGWGRE